ncbi:MAG: haloalkane dehalogenase [Bacteroidota bacterium]
MEFLTTPLSRFENIPDYPFAPNYLEVGDGLKMHYVDEGPNDGEVVLLLHGEPSWSFLYRKMIPIFVEAGFRTIAPDLIGFGKSDKPVELDAYTYASHLGWLRSFMDQLGLKNINLFCQDWGGLLGLRDAAENQGRYARIVAANTMLPTGDVTPNEDFLNWRQYALNVPEFKIGPLLNRATVSDLSAEEIAAYDAPFPDESYKAGARKFPALVPASQDDPETENNRAAWKQLRAFNKPFLTLFSDSDPIMKGLEQIFQKLIPGAQDQPHTIMKGGGHFLQEDNGPELAERMIAFIKAT